MTLGESKSSTVLLTTVAMVAFAANSLLCRMALGAGLIDAASFATLRVVAGAITLLVIVLPRWRTSGRQRADFLAVATLFTYVAFFSFAYLSLATGTGALILFGAVQLTMFSAALMAGERFSALSWSGLALALAGLVYLVSPGLEAPDPRGAALMAVAGIAWGVYSLRGRRSRDALGSTANAFMYSVPLVVVVSLFTIADASASTAGIVLALTSGALTSGLGYVVWYAALRGLSAGHAATVQLSVPAIAAFGGVVLLAEPVTLRLMLASALTLGGIWLVLARRAKRAGQD